MNLWKLFLIAAFTFGSTAFAAAPSFKFESNDDQRSFRLTLENPSSNKISCSLIEVSASIGSGDCGDVLAIYKFALKNQTFKGKSKIENANFGIDYLAQKVRALKNPILIYCGQPEVTLICE
jgi:hypothetical protein